MCAVRGHHPDAADAADSAPPPSTTFTAVADAADLDAVTPTSPLAVMPYFLGAAVQVSLHPPSLFLLILGFVELDPHFALQGLRAMFVSSWLKYFEFPGTGFFIFDRKTRFLLPSSSLLSPDSLTPPFLSSLLTPQSSLTPSAFLLPPPSSLIPPPYSLPPTAS